MTSLVMLVESLMKQALVVLARRCISAATARQGGAVIAVRLDRPAKGSANTGNVVCMLAIVIAIGACSRDSTRTATPEASPSPDLPSPSLQGPGSVEIETVVTDVEAPRVVLPAECVPGVVRATTEGPVGATAMMSMSILF